MAVDLDPLARAIDPRRLSTREFVQLFETIEMLVRTGAVQDLTSMGTPALTRLILRSSREQLDGTLSRPAVRMMVLNELIQRLPAQLNSARAANTDGVLRVELTDSAEPQAFQLVISGDYCKAGWVADVEPDVTIVATAGDFLRLALSTVSAAVLLARRRVTVRGELTMAVRMVRCFDIPKE